MSDQVIRGLCVTIQGSEIMAMAKERLQNATERLAKLEEALSRVDQMDPEDRELAGMKLHSGDMKDEVEKKIRSQKSTIRFHHFLSEHIEEEATYRLDVSQLKILGIENPYRY